MGNNNAELIGLTKACPEGVLTPPFPGPPLSSVTPHPTQPYNTNTCSSRQL